MYWRIASETCGTPRNDALHRTVIANSDAIGMKQSDVPLPKKHAMIIM